MSDKPDLEGLPAEAVNSDSGAALRANSARGGMVTLGAQSLKFALQLVCTAILARLLVPDDFGLVAMAVAITGFFGNLKDSSFMMSIIQAPKLTRRTLSTLFWANMGLSIALLVVLGAAAPLTAGFYGRPEITNLMLIMVAFLPITGLVAHYQAMLSRELRFSAIAAVELAALATASGTAIFMAWSGWGYWALVALTGLQPAISLLAYVLITRWLPGLPGRSLEVKNRLIFGSGLLVTSTVSYLTRHVDDVLIGAQWGAGALGNYSQAYRLLLLPIRQINDPLGRVLLPVLSQLRDTPEEFNRYFLTAISGIAYVTIPTVAAMAVLADLIVDVVLGDQWIMVGEIFRALAIAAALQALLNTLGWLYVSSGRSSRFLRNTLFNAGVIIVAILLALPAGPVAVAWAISIATAILWIPVTMHVCVPESLTPLQLTRAVLPAATLGLILATTSYGVLQLFFADEATDAGRQLIAFAAASAITGATALLWPSCRNEIAHFIRILRRAVSLRSMQESG